MEEPGFEIEAIDYMYMGNTGMKLDSLWSIALWGDDLPQTSYYLVTSRLNQAIFPMQMALFMDDKYFNGQKVVNFPIETLNQTDAVRRRYGDCGKYLETGDVFTLVIFSIPKDYYDYYTALASAAMGASIPMLQSQPANCPTNVVCTSGDGYATGYFAACSSSSSSVTIEEPLRPYYKKAMEGFVPPLP